MHFMAFLHFLFIYLFWSSNITNWAKIFDSYVTDKFHARAYPPLAMPLNFKDFKPL